MAVYFECDMCPMRDTTDNAGGYPIMVTNRVIASVCEDCAKRVPDLITAMLADVKKKAGSVLSQAMAGMGKPVDPMADTEKPKEPPEYPKPEGRS